jgi:hypothetical protein
MNGLTALGSSAVIAPPFEAFVALPLWRRRPGCCWSSGQRCGLAPPGANGEDLG